MREVDPQVAADLLRDAAILIGDAAYKTVETVARRMEDNAGQEHGFWTDYSLHDKIIPGGLVYVTVTVHLGLDPEENQKRIGRTKQ